MQAARTRQWAATCSLLLLFATAGLAVDQEEESAVRALKESESTEPRAEFYHDLAVRLIVERKREALGESHTQGKAGKPGTSQPGTKPTSSGAKAAAAEKAADDASCPTMQEAYLKFKGDMDRIEELEQQAQKRAQEAEKKAERERQAATECLGAQKMLKGSQANAQADMQKEIQRQVAAVKEKHQLELQSIKANWKTKLEDAVQKEKDHSDKRAHAQVTQVRLEGATALAEWKQKYKLLRADTTAMKASNRLTVTRLESDLKETRGHALSGMAGAQRAREADAAGAQTLRKINQNNVEALRLVKAQLHAKTKEASSCAKACGKQPVDFADDPDQPCPVRITHLLEQVNTAKASNEDFQKKATAEDARLVTTRVQLKSALEEVEELKRELADYKKQDVNAKLEHDIRGFEKTEAGQSETSAKPKPLNSQTQGADALELSQANATGLMPQTGQKSAQKLPMSVAKATPSAKRRDIVE